VIHHNVKQGTEEWLALRRGIPTASNFDRIITSSGKRSASAFEYAGELLGVWYDGEAIDEASSSFMDRGKDLEPRARDWYSFEYADAVPCGFFTDDLGRWGASPDGLVGIDGMVEIKCLALHNHIAEMLREKPPNDYFVQMQGQMFVTGRKWCDRVFYHPHLKPVVYRMERDEAFIEKLAGELEWFSGLLAKWKAENVKHIDAGEVPANMI